MHKSEHGKYNSGFVRSIHRNNVYNTKNKPHPFQGEDISQFSSRSEPWPPMNTNQNNFSAHPRPPQPIPYKEETRPHQLTLQPSVQGVTSSFTDNLIRRNRQRSIPPRFEHRLQPSLDHKASRPTEQNWRPGPDRTRSISLTPCHYDPHSHRKRAVGYQGLRTADLSNRQRYPKRDHFVSRHSVPRSVPSGASRTPAKGHVKDRLSIPQQKPERIVKRQPSPVDNDLSCNDASEVHIRSDTQNDPRIRAGDQKTAPEPEETGVPNNFNSEPFYQSPISSPIKPPSKGDQFFDEETQLKEVTPMEVVQNNFDVPLPPSLSPRASLSSPKQQVIQIPDEGEKHQVDNAHSFWDESDELNISSQKNTEQASSEVVLSPVKIADKTEAIPIISTKQNVGSFFDDEIPAPHEPRSKSTHSHRPNSSKPDREHAKPNKHSADKLRRQKRKGSPIPVKPHHLKRSPKKAKYPPRPPHPPHPTHHSSSKHRPKSDKNSPCSLISHPNAAILKLNTKSHTHIRMKKTVNLADKESEHSSSDDCTELPGSRKLVIPLPNSPLQPLELITGGEQVAPPVPTHTSSIISMHSNRQPSKETRKSADSSAVVESLSPRHSMNRRSLDDFLSFRNQSISESSEIGLHIEFVDDTTSNHPSQQARRSTERPPSSSSNRMGLLNIRSYKPVSPKSDLETPDSVFTPGFDSSQQGRPSFPLDTRSPLFHSPEYTPTIHSPNCNDNENLESDKSKYVSKHRSVKNMKRRSSKKTKQLRKTNSENSLCDTSITNKREVCIPITKLDMTQYGVKVKSTSQPPDNSISSKEKKIVKVFSQWKCMFCHRGANEKNLGYLYGPYFKTGENLKITPQPISSRKKASRDHDENELWVHAPCALWSPGVFLVSFHLRGLVEAFEDSQSAKCRECGNSGATLRCERDGCASVYHYTCAENSKCRFNHDCFKLQCPEHDSNL